VALHSARCCCLDYPSPRQCAVNVDRNFKPKLAIMRQCIVTDRRTDRRTLTSYHKREMYILHLALKTVHFIAAGATSARTQWAPHPVCMNLYIPTVHTYCQPQEPNVRTSPNLMTFSMLHVQCLKPLWWCCDK